MAYLGDIAPTQVLYTSFNTLAVTTAIPTTLAGSPVLSCYKDDSATETTTGITLTTDFDSRTGHHKVKIDTSNAFYAAGHDYQVVVTAGTVATVSIVGLVVAEFSIANRTINLNSIQAASSPTTLTNITIPTVTTVGTLATYTGNTVQTGDAYARQGAPAGASISADIAAVKSEVHTINTDTAVGAVWNGTKYV